MDDLFGFLGLMAQTFCQKRQYDFLCTAPLRHHRQFRFNSRLGPKQLATHIHRHHRGKQAMNTSFGSIDGNTWEKICQKLLRQKYTDYQEVPAQFGGDLGIEGFTPSGKVFQCYCPDENVTGKDLYERQRNKITNDIQKLILNLDDIADLGTGQIKEWQFLTPYFNNRKLHTHCRCKESEVTSLGSKHVALEFAISVRTEDDFITEKEAIFPTLGLCVHPSVQEPDATQLQALLESDNDLVQNIRAKLLKLEMPKDDSGRAKLTWRLVSNYLIGQQELEFLSQKYPVMYEKVVQLKLAREASVETLSLIHDGKAGILLKQTFDEYADKLRTDSKGQLASGLIDRLANEAIADWLGRCPLDFPDKNEVPNVH